MFAWFSASSCADVFFYDLETTGLNQYHDKIIEYTFLNQKGDNITSLVNPYKNKTYLPLNQKLKILTKISDDMIKDSPKFGDLLPSIIDFLGNSDSKYLVSHNNDIFDKIFLKNILKKQKYDINKLNLKFIDTLLLSKKLIPDLKSYSLKNVCTHLKIPFKSTHRTLEDTKMVAKLYKKLLEKLSENENVKIDDLVNNPELVYNYLYN